MKTSELIGPALDWAVAKCEGFRTELNYQYTDDHKFNGWWQCGPNHWQPLCKYSTDWPQGGPIIEREAITLSAYCGKNDSVDWYAGRYSLKSPTPLIAAMRCYVTSELGDDVEIPKELLN